MGNKKHKEAIKFLDEFEKKAGGDFHYLKDFFLKNIPKHKKAFDKGLKEASSVDEYMLIMIADWAGDLLESGRFHMYRGVLNPSGPGPGLLKVYDLAVDELVSIGVEDKETAENNKSGLRKNIENVG